MSSYTEITETALVVKSDWSNKAVMQFHYFNPNGLYAAKKRVFTSLLNAELVWHSGTGREAGVGLTEEGYKVFRATTKKN